MNLNPVYLDYNATTPLAEAVRAQVPQWLGEWGNPSSIHWAGRGPKGILREARRRVGEMLGAHPLEIIFTSGGGEANNMALKGVFTDHLINKNSRNQLIVSAVEHPTVMKAAMSLKKQGVRVDVIPVNRHGEINLEVYKSLLREQTALVSVMYANNETGHIFPIERMAQMAHQVGALFHCDAVQALGKVPFKLDELGVDLASFSAHKFYALKGCGVLYSRKGTQFESLIHGGGQERGRRAGTENVLAIASLGLMTEKSGEIPSRALKMTELRDYFEKRALSEISEVAAVGADGQRLPNASKLLIAGVDGETLLMNLDVRGFAISTGAACSSGSPEPSPVLLAMGYTRLEAQTSLRVSLGWNTTQDEIDALVDALKEVVARLRSFRHGEQFVYGL